MRTGKLFFMSPTYILYTVNTLIRGQFWCSLKMILDIDSEIREADDTSDDNGVSTDSCLAFQDNYDTEDTCLQPDWISYGYRSFSYIFLV